MALALRLLKVFLAGYVPSLVPAMLMASRVEAPFWYQALVALIGAVGIGLIGIGFGLLALMAKRGSEDGGTRAGMLTAVIAGSLVSAIVFKSL